MKGSNASGQKTTLVMVRAIIVGAVVGALICALMLAVCSLAFVSAENIPHDFLPAFLLAVTIVSSFFAGFVTAKIAKQKGLLCGAAAGILLFLLFLISNVAMSQNGGGEIFMRLLLMVLSGGIGGLVAVNGKARRK